MIVLRGLIGIGMAALLSACSVPSGGGLAQRNAPMKVSLPPMKTFGAPTVTPTARSNRQLAADFLELSFEMESGKSLPVLTRFEGPVTVAVRGTAPPTLSGDLSRLLGRFQREAGIDISMARPGQTPNIVIEVLSRQDIQRLVPQAACFVVPRVSSWEEFKSKRRTREVDWSTLKTRQRAAIFLPGDVSPQETRDCLHEELAQALGPLNDLYRLPDSVFNDDNFHTVLTGFDMLMLKVYYDDTLHSGMRSGQVADRLPGILARVNPRGQFKGGALPRRTPRPWIDAIETALGPRTGSKQRLVAARRAVTISEAYGWKDTRRAFSLYVLGRLSLNDDPELALAAFLEASAIYRARPDTKVQAAHVAMQLSAFSLSSGQLNGTLGLVNESIPPVRAAENAALLSTLMLMKAEALRLQGRGAEAGRVRNEALGWARYGFGSEQVVRARLTEINALAPTGSGS